MRNRRQFTVKKVQKNVAYDVINDEKLKNFPVDESLKVQSCTDASIRQQIDNNNKTINLKCMF